MTLTQRSSKLLDAFFKAFQFFEEVAAKLFSQALVDRTFLSFGSRLLEEFACAWNGIALVVEQMLDLLEVLEVFIRVKTLASTCLVRFQERKLRLPETQNVRNHSNFLRSLFDAVKRHADKKAQLWHGVYRSIIQDS